MAVASGKEVHVEVDPDALDAAISPLSRTICDAIGIDPRGAISSGAMLIGADASVVEEIKTALADAGIACWPIGVVREGSLPSGRWCTMLGSSIDWPAFERDEIARLFSGSAGR
jgi:hydrogenase maturation factor